MEEMSKPEEQVVLKNEEVLSVDNLLPEMEKELSVLETIVQKAIISVHEDMDGLILKANKIVVDVNDKKSYDEAMELKREIKSTHVDMKKRKEEFKKPVIAYGKRLEEFTKGKYDPLVNAEKLLVKKIEPYKLHQLQLKANAEKIQNEENERLKNIEDKLFELNSTLGLVNQCKIKSDVDAIEERLGEIDLKEFGERSDEAGFIIQNLLMTCKMFKNNLPDTLETPPVKEEKVFQSEGLSPKLIEDNKDVKNTVVTESFDKKETDKFEEKSSEQTSVEENSVEQNSFNIKIDNVSKDKVIKTSLLSESEVEDSKNTNDLPQSKNQDDIIDSKPLVLGESMEIDAFGSLSAEVFETNEKKENLESEIPSDKKVSNDVSLENEDYCVDLCFNADGSDFPIQIRLTHKKTGEIIFFTKQ